MRNKHVYGGPYSNCKLYPLYFLRKSQKTAFCSPKIGKIRGICISASEGRIDSYYSLKDMRNMHVYISTYNILKLYLLQILRKSQKTVFALCDKRKMLTSHIRVVETCSWA